MEEIAVPEDGDDALRPNLFLFGVGWDDCGRPKAPSIASPSHRHPIVFCIMHTYRALSRVAKASTRRLKTS